MQYFLNFTIIIIASYEAAKNKEQIACEQSDINTASEAESRSIPKERRGCRTRTAARRYSPDSEDLVSSDSSDGMYGPTQPILPNHPIPDGLLRNGLNTSQSKFL